MKRTLFLQDIFMAVSAIVLTFLLTTVCFGMFGTVADIPINGGRISCDSVLMRSNEVIYSTRRLSPSDKQHLALSVKTGEDFSSGGTSYSINTTDFKDGSTMVILSPNVNTPLLRKIRITAYPVVFTICYIFLALLVGKNRKRDIIFPLCTLREQCRRLSEGDYDINIAERGAEDIRRLANSIENLRIKLKDQAYLNKKSAEDREFLISSISHDLRTPITALRGYLDGILDGIADSQEKKRIYLQKSIEKTELINFMISDLLLYSKLDSNQVDFKFQTINLAEYLTAFTEENRIIFESAKKHISFDIQKELEYNVSVDMEQFDRVMGNIIENSLRYTCSGSGTVRILLRTAGNCAIIEIWDNGIGIAEDELPKIFDKFYRGEKSRKIKGSSGLGLAISKRIIENMGGRIWAKSKLGEGTSIMISLKKHMGD